MPDYVDLRWHGPERTMDAALAALPPPSAQAGPLVLDGTAYVLRRERGTRPVPDGLAETGTQLSAAIVGVIA